MAEARLQATLSAVRESLDVIVARERPRPLSYLVFATLCLLLLSGWMVASALRTACSTAEPTQIIRVAFGGAAEGATYDARFVDAVIRLNQSLLIPLGLVSSLVASWGRRRTFKELTELRTRLEEIAGRNVASRVNDWRESRYGGSKGGV